MKNDKNLIANFFSLILS